MLIILAGPVCAGKTTLAASLADSLEGKILAARSVIERHSQAVTRAELQEAGAELEARWPGRWLAEAVADFTGPGPLVIDAAKTNAQLVALLELGVSMSVYLDAAPEVCRRRFLQRSDPADEGGSFDQLVEGEFAEQPELKASADLIVNTDDRSAKEVADLTLTEIRRRYSIEG